MHSHFLRSTQKKYESYNFAKMAKATVNIICTYKAMKKNLLKNLFISFTVFSLISAIVLFLLWANVHSFFVCACFFFIIIYFILLYNSLSQVATMNEMKSVNEIRCTCECVYICVVFSVQGHLTTTITLCTHHEMINNFSTIFISCFIITIFFDYFWINEFWVNII